MIAQSLARWAVPCALLAAPGDGVLTRFFTCLSGCLAPIPGALP